MDDLTQVKYSDTFFTDKYTICGVRLKDFCLGHLILLEFINNPLIKTDKLDLDIVDGTFNFFMALLICSLSYEDGEKLITDPDLLNEEMNKFSDNLKKNMDLDPKWNIVSKIDLFKQYMGVHLDMPLYDNKQKSSGEDQSGNDWKTSIFLVFKKMDYSESAVLNMNIKRLFNLWAAYAESEGAIRLMNKYDVQAVKSLKKFN